MKKINYSELFETLDKVMGLPLKRKGRKWYGKCKLDGSLHGRWDKVSCFMGRTGKIKVIEQGGFSADLYEYIKVYMNKTDLEAGNYLRDHCTTDYVTPEWIEPEVKYVYNSSMNKTLWKYNDNLFKFLCTLFPESRVRKAYNLYKVGSRGVNPVFWCINKEGQIGHDKEMPYVLSTGKRDKSTTLNRDGREIMANPPKRVYKTKFGYSSTPAFGEHLLKQYSSEQVYCVESEKTALLFYLMYGKLCLGLGGSGCLFKAPKGSILLGDKDEAGLKWLEAGGLKWWDSYDVPVEEGDDIGDVIIKLRK